MNDTGLEIAKGLLIILGVVGFFYFVLPALIRALYWVLFWALFFKKK